MAGSARPTGSRSPTRRRPGRCRPACPRARAARDLARRPARGARPPPARDAGADDHDPGPLGARERRQAAAAREADAQARAPRPRSRPPSATRRWPDTPRRQQRARPAARAGSSQRVPEAPSLQACRENPLPLGAVVLHEDLVVEAIDLDGHRGHVRREREQRRRGVDGEKAQARAGTRAAASSRPRRPARSPTRRTTARRRDTGAAPARRCASSRRCTRTTAARTSARSPAPP